MQQRHASKMLLMHQTGNLKVGEVVRYVPPSRGMYKRILTLDV